MSAPEAVVPQNQRGTVNAGVGFSLACQFAVWAVFHVLGSLWRILGWGTLLWGVVQWFLVVPLIINLKKQGKDKTVKGLLIVSLLGVVLNAGLIFLGYWALNNLSY